MPEEKSDWVIGEGDPFPKTPIKRWDANTRAIKLSRQLEEEGGSVTREERSDLVKYSGLGDSAFEQAFSYHGARTPHGRSVVPSWRSWYPMSSWRESDVPALTPSTRRRR